MTEIADIKDVLIELGFHNLRQESDGWRTNRIYADGDNPTALKIFKTGFWIDFVENKRGFMPQLVSLVKGHKNIEESEKWLSEHKIDIVRKQEQIKPKISEPKKFDKSTLQNLLPVHEYWLNRGISLDTILKFRGGLCTKECKMKDRYVLPIFNGKDEILGFCARDITNKSDIKYKIVGQKMNFIWPAAVNYEDIKEKGEVILLESQGDGLSLYESGIKHFLCLFGTEISFQQINYLLKLNLNRIIISLNNDSENNSVGNLAAEKLRKKLLKYWDYPQVSVLLPNLKDWNEVLTKEGKSSIIKQLA